jgi:hypothetical protein
MQNEDIVSDHCFYTLNHYLLFFQVQKPGGVSSWGINSKELCNTIQVIVCAMNGMLSKAQKLPTIFWLLITHSHTHRHTQLDRQAHRTTHTYTHANIIHYHSQCCFISNSTMLQKLSWDAYEYTVFFRNCRRYKSNRFNLLLCSHKQYFFIIG